MWDYQEESSPHKTIVDNRTNKQLKKAINKSTHVKSAEKKKSMTWHRRIWNGDG